MKACDDRNDKSCNYYEFSIASQNVRGLKNDAKLEGILNYMIENNVHVFLFQETWLVGNKTQVIRGHMIFFHGLNKLLNRRGERGVVITFSPKFTEFYESAGGCCQSQRHRMEMIRVVDVTLKFL